MERILASHLKVQYKISFIQLVPVDIRVDKFWAFRASTKDPLRTFRIFASTYQPTIAMAICLRNNEMGLKNYEEMESIWEPCYYHATFLFCIH